MPKIIAVTGGAGFIGKSVVEEIRHRGMLPRVIDRENNRDILDGTKMAAWLAECDSVIHLAGVLGTAELFDNPCKAVDVNVKGTLHVLQSCVINNCGFVGIAMPECWPNVYQATKYCAKSLAEAWRINYGLSVSHVRAFNAFGIGQKYGGNHPQKIIPTFSSLAWKGEAIPIWGDGEQVVDLIHVDDIARMLVDASSFYNGEVFDAGTGLGRTVNSIAQKIINVTGRGTIKYLPMRDGETPTDATCAKGEGWPKLDWRPLFDEKKFLQTVLSYSPENSK